MPRRMSGSSRGRELNARRGGSCHVRTRSSSSGALRHVSAKLSRREQDPTANKPSRRPPERARGALRSSRTSTATAHRSPSRPARKRRSPGCWPTTAAAMPVQQPTAVFSSLDPPAGRAECAARITALAPPAVARRPPPPQRATYSVDFNIRSASWHTARRRSRTRSHVPRLARPQRQHAAARAVRPPTDLTTGRSSSSWRWTRWSTPACVRQAAQSTWRSRPCGRLPRVAIFWARLRGRLERGSNAARRPALRRNLPSRDAAPRARRGLDDDQPLRFEGRIMVRVVPCSSGARRGGQRDRPRGTSFSRLPPPRELRARPDRRRALNR